MTQGQNRLVDIHYAPTHNLCCTFVSVLIVTLHHLSNMSLVVSHNMSLSWTKEVRCRPAALLRLTWVCPLAAWHSRSVCASETGPLSSMQCMQAFLSLGLAVSAIISELWFENRWSAGSLMLVFCLFFSIGVPGLRKVNENQTSVCNNIFESWCNPEFGLRSVQSCQYPFSVSPLSSPVMLQLLKISFQGLK